MWGLCFLGRPIGTKICCMQQAGDGALGEAGERGKWRDGGRDGCRIFATRSRVTFKMVGRAVGARLQ